MPLSAGLHGSRSSGSSCGSRAGSHELEDTYGAYRLRDKPLGVPGGSPGARHPVGSMPPSSFWLEHRAAAHHTAAGEPSSACVSYSNSPILLCTHCRIDGPYGALILNFPRPMPRLSLWSSSQEKAGHGVIL